jgi:hypothetical protein
MSWFGARVAMLGLVLGRAGHFWPPPRKEKNAFLELSGSYMGTNPNFTSACDVIFAARSLDAREGAR